MELKKKISLDAEQILKESEVLKELSDSEMNHLKGGCLFWLFGGDTTTSGGSTIQCPPTGCATASAGRDMF